MAKEKIGDVIEIPTSKGLAYGLFSHEHRDPPKWGPVLRVLKGLHGVRPAVHEIAACPPWFTVFYHLRSALKQGLVSIVGNIALPDWAVPFPTFRDGYSETSDWVVWDGKQEVKAGPLTPSLRSLPVRILITHAILLEFIERGYDPERDVHQASGLALTTIEGMPEQDAILALRKKLGLQSD